jgi:hypothetical protein
MFISFEPSISVRENRSLRKEKFPVFEGSTEKYLKEMSRFTRKRQRQLLSSVRKEFDIIVKSYWHTHMISGLVHHSYLEHHKRNGEVFTEYFKKWAGIWVRHLESQNILFDSMTLGLEGRTTSASSLLRPALESIVTGVFFHYLSQIECREKAFVIEKSDSGRKSGRKFLDIVKQAIERIEDKTAIPVELERQVTRILLQSEPTLHMPKLKVMLEQIDEWEILIVKGVKLVDLLKKKMFDPLSTYSHSLHETSYARRGLDTGRPEIMFGWAVDPESFQEYSAAFKSTCIVVLTFFLASTEELQKTAQFSEIIKHYLRENPEVTSLFSSIVKSIETVIGSSSS